MRALLPYAQLLRLPNVFTALADIGMAALASALFPEHLPAFVLLLIASACLYCSGMVWNDYFDLAEDKRDRPFRPLASGRIALVEARRLGLILMVAGVLCAAAADIRGTGYRGLSTTLALLLCAAIFLYDTWLKRIWAGPLGMGLCRLLNVLLGLSVAPVWPGSWGWLLALVVGLYIVGVTWFARTEAVTSNQTMLLGAALCILAALLLALAVPSVVPVSVVPRDDDTLRPLSTQVQLGQLLYPYLLAAFGFFLGAAVVRGIRRPTPAHVQAAVKRCILGLVVLDALLASAVVGPFALLLVLLLVPAYYLGQWVYST